MCSWVLKGQKISSHLSLDLTFPQEDDLVGLLGEVEAVGGQHDRPLPLHQDLEDADVEDVAGDVGVESREGRVQERAGGLGIKSPSDGQPLALPTCNRATAVTGTAVFFRSLGY